MTRYFEINQNGHNIRCKLYYQDLRSIRRAVIFCHGFGGHKDNGAAERFADRLLAKYKNTALITFNWPCHGDDVKKKLCLGDCDAYLSLVIDYARDQLGAESLFCYATSFGGYLTLKYISDHGSPFRKTVLRCPAVGMYEVLTGSIMTDGDLERLSRGKPIPIGFDRKIPLTQSFLDELRENDIRCRDYLDWAEDILILQGTNDEIVAFDSVSEFCENSLIEMIPIPGADHRFRDPVKMDLAIKHILEFFYQS